MLNQFSAANGVDCGWLPEGPPLNTSLQNVLALIDEAFAVLNGMKAALFTRRNSRMKHSIGRYPMKSG